MPVPVWFPGRRPVPPGRQQPLTFEWKGGAPAGPSRVAEYSTALELSVFGSFPGVSPGDTINSVTLTVSQFASTALMGPPSYELWDDSGTPALLGSGTGTVSTSTGNVDSLVFANVTYAMLATLRVRVYAHQGTAPSGSIQNVNWVNLTANITPAANSAGLAHGTGTAQGARAAVAVTAVLAAGTGAAQSPAAAAAVPAAPATGTGTARSPAAAAGVNAALASGTGAAQSPAITTAASVTAVLAPGTGAAQSPAAAIGVNAAAAGDCAVPVPGARTAVTEAAVVIAGEIGRASCRERV